ncbi:hypothetical protein TVAG_413720 [Trichomonas vaginalis G3]|uniref:Uncharacterized protein n=1 Tax=Trichomonas vaginalis (strain ATCC PRA-98 / G3) TaxID=412133 RepID=A2EC47_TRIV3|nr:microtubule binding [Trichomonas vaginalis G3]EAY09724.1 hypothetical protein TVAG_413720 [Trichomonas vaginalis G3]KAI5550865.1 microtubule binding [Trichomonas vaginalis G3]|eukprot:XP_001321947.1 hypothetical protein [Trichomonas vaginalis G3]
MTENESFLSETSNQITKLWNEIGYTMSETKKEKKQIEEELLNVLATHLQKVQQEKKDIEDKIQQLTENYRNLQQAVGQKPSAEIQLPQTSLRQRHNEILAQYLALRNQFKDKIQSFQVLQTEIESQFDILGVPAEQRGEFTSVGDKDLSDARYYRFKSKNSELAKEIENRTATMTENLKTINDTLNELDEKIPKEIDDLFLSDSITNESMQKVDEYMRNLNAERENRIKDLKDVAQEIIYMWQILNTSKVEQDKFFATHSTLSRSNIESSKEELKRLQNQRIQQLPEIITRQQSEIQQLCDKLHVGTSVDITINPKVITNKEEVFNDYQEEILKLKSILADASSFFDLIEQREALVFEQNSIEHARNVRAKSKNNFTEPSIKVKEENDLRRCRNLLPRIERKLKLALLEFRGRHESDFMWDGQPYIGYLDHIILSDMEINRALNSSRREVRKSRKSVAPTAEPLLHEKSIKARCKTDVYGMQPKHLMNL